MKVSPAHLAYAVAACLTALVLASPAFAAPATAADDKTPLNLPTSEPAREAATSSGSGGIARFVVGLFIVIAVIYGLAWVLKQVKASKEGSASGAGLAALSSLPLGPGRSVHLVRAGTDLVLLGVAEKGITPIRTYTEDEAREAGLLGDEHTPALPPARDGGKAAGGQRILEALRERTVRR